MNVFSYETKAVLKSSVIWAVSLMLGALMMISMYPGFAKDMQAFREILASYPPQVLVAFGAEMDIVETFGGFFAFGMIYVIFAGAVQGMMLGIRSVSREFNEKTAEFLYTKPVTRTHVLQHKLLAAGCNVLFTVCLYGILTYLCAISIVGQDKVDMKVYLLLTLTLFLIEILFLSFGFLTGVLLGKVKSPIMLSLGVVSCFFLVELIGNSTDEWFVHLVSVFNYFTPAKVVEDGGLEWSYVLLCLVLTTLCFGTGLVIFKKKDIHVG